MKKLHSGRDKKQIVLEEGRPPHNTIQNQNHPVLLTKSTQGPLWGKSLVRKNKEEMLPKQQAPPSSAARTTTGLLRKSFPSEGVAARQWMFEIRISLLLDGLSAKFASPIYPKHLVLRHDKPTWAPSPVGVTTGGPNRI